MHAKPRDAQGELYSVRLDFLYKESHLLARLSKVIDGPHCDQIFGDCSKTVFNPPPQDK